MLRFKWSEIVDQQSSYRLGQPSVVMKLNHPAPRVKALFLVVTLFSYSVVVATGQSLTLTNGGNHDGAITANQSNQWSFVANAGDRVVLRDGRLTGSGFNPWMRLFAPDGALIGDTGSLNNDIAHEIAVTANLSGTYNVVVADSAFGGANDVGTYRLFFARLPGSFGVADQGGALTNGANHDGEITIGDLDLWSFNANAGDRVVLRSGRQSGANFNPWMRVYSPDGVLILDSGGANSQVAQELTLTATNNGTFTVLVTDSNAGNPDDTGTYRLHFFKLPGLPVAADDAGELANGASHVATITTGDLDIWSFVANPGDNFIVRASRIDGDTVFNPWLRIYGPTGELLADGGASAQIVQELALTAGTGGRYFVLVGDGVSGNLDDTGTYRIAFVLVPGLDIFSRVDGRLTNDVSATAFLQIGDLDAWQFVACRGETVRIRVNRLTSTNTFDPLVRMYGPTGALLATATGGAEVQAQVVTADSGLFTVVVADGSSGGREGAGDFRITATGILNDTLQLCRPLITGANLDLSGLGGRAGATFVVQTTTNVALHGSLWTPIYTNQFGPLGIFRKSDFPYSGEPMRFFRLQQQ